jgi:hypothetical protein
VHSSGGNLVHAVLPGDNVCILPGLELFLLWLLPTLAILLRLHEGLAFRALKAFSWTAPSCLLRQIPCPTALYPSLDSPLVGRMAEADVLDMSPALREHVSCTRDAILYCGLGVRHGSCGSTLENWRLEAAAEGLAWMGFVGYRIVLIDFSSLGCESWDEGGPTNGSCLSGQSCCQAKVTWGNLS